MQACVRRQPCYATVLLKSSVFSCSPNLTGASRAGPCPSRCPELLAQTTFSPTSVLDMPPSMVPQMASAWRRAEKALRDPLPLLSFHLVSFRREGSRNPHGPPDSEAPPRLLYWFSLRPWREGPAYRSRSATGPFPLACVAR